MGVASYLEDICDRSLSQLRSLRGTQEEKTNGYIDSTINRIESVREEFVNLLNSLGDDKIGLIDEIARLKIELVNKEGESISIEAKNKILANEIIKLRRQLALISKKYSELEPAFNTLESTAIKNINQSKCSRKNSKSTGKKSKRTQRKEGDRRKSIKSKSTKNRSPSLKRYNAQSSEKRVPNPAMKEAFEKAGLEGSD